MNKLAILLWAATPEEPDRCAAPFVYATAAAALDCEVEIHFSGASVRLLVPGVAEQAVTAGGKNVHAFMREAANLGVRFFACAMARRRYADSMPLIDEYAGEAGAAAFAARAVDPAWRTLVF